MRSITAPTPTTGPPVEASKPASHPGFIKIPHELIGAVSPGALLVWAVLADDQRPGWQRRTHAEIARRCGWDSSPSANARRVGRAVHELVEVGWLARRTEWVAAETSVPLYRTRPAARRWEPLPRAAIATAVEANQDAALLMAHYLGWKRIAGRSRWTEAPISQVADLLGAPRATVSRVRRRLAGLGLVVVEHRAGRAPRMWFDPEDLEGLKRPDGGDDRDCDPPHLVSDGSPHLVSDDPSRFVSPIEIDALLDEPLDPRLASASRSQIVREPAADKPPSSRRIRQEDEAGRAARLFVAEHPSLAHAPGRVRGQCRQLLARRLRHLPQSMSIQATLQVLGERLDAEAVLGHDHCAVLRRLLAGVQADAKARPELDEAPLVDIGQNPLMGPGESHALEDLACGDDRLVAGMARRALPCETPAQRHQAVTRMLTVMEGRCAPGQVDELYGAAMRIRHAIDADAAVEEARSW